MSQTETPTSAAEPTGTAHTGESASLGRVLRDQKKVLWIGLFFMVVSFWVCGPLGRWTLGTAIAAGVALAVANHVATEFWLLKTITSGQQPSRNELIAATLVRLAVLSLVAVGIAVYFWPDGIGLLLGLAIFRLIALVMTSVPLLKELNNP